jgi:hypothetical protein
MTLPNTSVTFLNGGLGIVPSGAGKNSIKVGISLSGATNTIMVCASPTIAKRLLGGGSLCDCTVNQTKRSGATVFAINVPINSAGTVGSLTQQGTGAGVPTGAAGPVYQILAKCVTGGTLGTAAFQFSVNGGAYGTTQTSTASSWAYRVPGTYTTLTFAAATYRLNDVYTIATTGTVSASSPSGGPDTITQVSSPLDAFRLIVTITKAGARGTAEFDYSLDDGGNVSQTYATAATFVIPGAGIVLSFSNAAYVAGDIFTGTTTGPAFASSDAQAAIEIALKSAYEFEGIHIVGTSSSASNAATMATMLDTELQAAATTYNRYIWGVSECPTVEADATVQAAFASVTSTTGRLGVAIGDCDLLSGDSGLLMKRNAAWPYSTRLAATKYSTHPGFVDSGNGALPGVQAIYAAYGGGPVADTFDGSRFITLRTIQGKAGYYVCRGNTMDVPTSDYHAVQFVRVINRAATIAQTAMADYLNGDWRLDPDTGHIDERDAANVESGLREKIRAAMMGEAGSANDDISGVSVAIDRSADLSATATLTVTVSILPKGYSEYIDIPIGFVNPMLTS